MDILITGGAAKSTSEVNLVLVIDTLRRTDVFTEIKSE